MAESGEPLSRQSLADLARRVQDRIGRPMSRSTICRILHRDAIKPWQPFGRLLDQVLGMPVYRSAKRIFVVVDNGSSHRGEAAARRAAERDSRIVLVHLPVHASWLNQVEVYFSLVQRKVLTPNDYPDLDALRARLALYEELTNRTPKPFEWNFTRQKLREWLKRARPQFPSPPGD